MELVQFLLVCFSYSSLHTNLHNEIKICEEGGRVCFCYADGGRFCSECYPHSLLGGTGAAVAEIIGTKEG